MEQKKFRLVNNEVTENAVSAINTLIDIALKSQGVSAIQIVDILRSEIRFEEIKEGKEDTVQSE